MATPPDQERRVEPRAAVKAPARVFYGPGLELWADCVIRDESKLGVKVELPKVFQVPERVLLLILKTGIAFDVLVKWRRRDMAGLQFEVRYDLSGTIAERLNPVRETWLALQGRGSSG